MVVIPRFRTARRTAVQRPDYRSPSILVTVENPGVASAGNPGSGFVFRRCALMGLGIERDRLGDLLVTADSVRILCDSKMAEYLLQNLTKIGAVGVSCEMADLAGIAPREERCKEIRATVASLRIDSIAASGFGSSRSRAAADIAADKMKLNWQPVKSASQTVKEGDIISMRGRGRLEVAEVRGQTKKGRTVVVLKRYI